MELESKELDQLGKYTKELINSGIYYLYTIESKDKIKSKYVLRVQDGRFYGLSSTGSINFKENELPEGISLLETVYFSDVYVPLINSDILNKTNVLVCE